MSVLEIIRLIIGSLFLFAGVCVFILEVMGIFRMKYVLNRMHAAAMGDTMGLFLSLTGLCVLNGLNFTTAKIVLIIILFWISSPVSSHMTALIECFTNYKINKRLSYMGDLETLEKRLNKEKESK